MSEGNSGEKYYSQEAASAADAVQRAYEGEQRKPRLDVFDIYFASLAAWCLHPGYTRDGVSPPTMEECADLAQYMLRIRDERIRIWRG